ncbi:MAG: hypothetical protein K0S44_2919 [Bacteroidetes bacterium]|jgi:hypothetical protein|nr:hypothetical protein [Bacteroidota bacterium]
MKLLVLTPFILLCLSATQTNAQTSLPSGKTSTARSPEVISVPEPKTKNTNSGVIRDDEKIALSMLNTTEIPTDFPRFQSEMSSVAYEKLVYEWFLKNPDKRKETTSTPQ